MTHYVRRHGNCDRTGVVSIPTAHIQSRTCAATGAQYWTVDVDPNDYCPIHQPEDSGDGECPF